MFSTQPYSAAVMTETITNNTCRLWVLSTTRLCVIHISSFILTSNRRVFVMFSVGSKSHLKHYMSAKCNVIHLACLLTWQDHESTDAYRCNTKVNGMCHNYTTETPTFLKGLQFPRSKAAFMKAA